MAKRLSVSKINQDGVKQILIHDLENKVNDLKSDTENVETHWASFRDTVYPTWLQHLGSTSKCQQDWLNDTYEEI